MIGALGIGRTMLRRALDHLERDHSSFAEHAAIAAAIEARDPDRSAEAMRRHLGSVARRLFGDV
ncbi:MAG: FCD domain-containing protein [Qingshengfaniella sp.]